MNNFAIFLLFNVQIETYIARATRYTKDEYIVYWNMSIDVYSPWQSIPLVIGVGVCTILVAVGLHNDKQYLTVFIIIITTSKYLSIDDDLQRNEFV